VCLALSLIASADIGERHAIFAAQVEKFLAGGDVDAGSRYRLAMPEVLSTVEEPVLRLEGKSVAGSKLVLRVACSAAAQCLPFYVELRFASSPAAAVFSSRLEVTEHRRTLRAKARPPVLVHGGALAKLEVVVSRDVKLYFYVRCLQSGAAGETVRVRDDKTRRNYLAQVIDQGKLRTEL
jgi:hypothetical protein